MDWIRVLSEEDLPPGTRETVDVSGEEILLIHDRGEIHAVAGRCPHMGARLEKGEISADGTIICPRHRSEFDLATGGVEAWAPWPPVVGRALGAMSRQKDLPVYPTKVEDGAIWLGIRKPE